MQVQSVELGQCGLLIRYYWGDCSSPSGHNFMLSVAWDEQLVSQTSYMITTKTFSVQQNKTGLNRFNKNISSSR